MHVKLIQKGRFKKQQKQLVISLEIKLPIKLQESQKLHYRIIEKQEKRKYLEKDMHHHNKGRKLLMI